MFYLSNKKLRLLIITLLLMIFCMFIGLFDVKAENMFNYEPTSWYCPHGSFQNNQVLSDKRYFGCSDTRQALTSDARMELTYSGFNNGNYDIGGTLLLYTDIVSEINVYANNVSCFITNFTSNNVPSVLSFYCFNVPVENGTLKFETNGMFTTLGSGSSKYGFARTWDLTTHFDKSVNNQITNIQNNTTQINDSINDSSIDTNGATSSATSWNNKNATNGTITSLLTLPITLLQAIVNGLQTSCSSFSLGSLFGTNLTLPCINLNSLLGSTLFSIIDVLISGLMIFAIAKKLIKIFNDFTNLKSNQMDELYGGGK